MLERLEVRISKFLDSLMFTIKKPGPEGKVLYEFTNVSRKWGVDKAGEWIQNYKKEYETLKEICKVPDDISELTVEELEQAIERFEKAIVEWPEDETGADHVALFKARYEQELETKKNEKNAESE